MTISQPRVQLMSTTLRTTSETPTDWYYPHPAATRTLFTISSDVNLVVDVDELGMGNVAVEIDAAHAVVGGGPALVIDIDFGTAPVRLRITPASQPAVVTVEARYNGVPWM